MRLEIRLLFCTTVLLCTWSGFPLLAQTNILNEIRREVNAVEEQAATDSTDEVSGLMLSDFYAQNPFILAYAPENIYYLFTTGHTEDGRGTVLAYKSENLKSWQEPQTIFAVPDDSWANPFDGIWAPEVHEFNGKYYLFVTLNNRDDIFAEPPKVWRANYRRATVIAEADVPEGPYELLQTNRPHAPFEFMTSDGTLYVDPSGKPWMVYSHEWIQVLDGMIEGLPLSQDLTGTETDPVYLFKASDGPWLAKLDKVTNDQRTYTGDGPQLFRTKDNHLLMLWSTHTLQDGYIQAVARSQTGELTGPWEQLGTLVGEDSGHGMLFETFEGQLMMVLHRPFGQNARAKLYEVEDLGHRLQIGEHRDDLDTRESGGEIGTRGGRGQRGGFGRGGAARGGFGRGGAGPGGIGREGFGRGGAGRGQQ